MLARPLRVVDVLSLLSVARERRVLLTSSYDKSVRYKPHHVRNIDKERVAKVVLKT
jgi:hypothetical protein